MKITDQVEPKMAHRFTMKFHEFGDGTQDALLGPQVLSLSRPVLRLPHGSFDWFEVVLQDDVSNVVHRQVLKQIRRQLRADKSLTDGTFTILVQLQDSDGRTIETIKLVKCSIHEYKLHTLDLAAIETCTIHLTVESSMNPFHYIDGLLGEFYYHGFETENEALPEEA